MSETCFSVVNDLKLYTVHVGPEASVIKGNKKRNFTPVLVAV